MQSLVTSEQIQSPSVRAPWRRQHIVAGTGEPVELLAIEERAGVRRYWVERPCGRRWLLTEPQLASRLVWLM